MLTDPAMLIQVGAATLPQKIDRFDLQPVLKRAGITQEDIARRAQCSQQNVSKYLQGLHASERVAEAIEQLLKESLPAPAGEAA